MAPWNLHLLWLSCVFLLLHNSAIHTSAWNLSLDTPETPVAVGSQVLISASVEPTDNITCILYYGDDNSSWMVSVCLNESTTGLLVYNYSYETAATYSVMFECANDTENATVMKNITVQEVVTGLTWDNTTNPTVLELVNGSIEGYLNFTFTNGTHLNAVCKISNGVSCSSTVSVNTDVKQARVNFQANDLTHHDYYTVILTLFNAVSNQTATATVLYEERIHNLFIVGTDFVAVNTSTTVNVTLDSGSHVKYEWSVSGYNSTTAWLFCPENNSIGSFTPFVSTFGIVHIQVVASNHLGAETASHSMVSLQPVELFRANTTSDLPGSDLILETTSVYAGYMGNLTVNVSDGSLTNTTTVTPKWPNETYVILSSMKQGDKTFTVHIASPISSMTFGVQLSLWPPVNTSLYINTKTVEVDTANISVIETGNAFPVEILNTTGWGYNYDIDFGNGSKTRISETDKTRTTNFYMDMLYSSEGVYMFRVNVSNGRYRQELEQVIRAFNPVPTFSFPTSSLVTIPPGHLTLNVSVPSDAPGPTNASCFLDQKEQSSTVERLNNFTWTQVFNENQNVTFSRTGHFNISLTCANLLNTVVKFWEVNVKSLSAESFEIAYNSLVGFNTTSEGVDVTYFISLFDNSYIPPNVVFSWDFKDGSDAVSSTLEYWTFTHTFTKKGSFNSSLSILVINSSQHVLILPIQIGVLTISTNFTTGEVNSDVLGLHIGGAKGLNVSYSVDYGDDDLVLCYKNDVSNDFILSNSKMYTADGAYRIRVLVSSELFVEEWREDVYMQWPVAELALVLDDEVIYPAGEATVAIVRDGSAPSSTNVSCDISLNGNTLLKDARSLPSVTKHMITTLGQAKFTVVCNNSVSSLVLENTTVVKSNCFAPGRPFQHLTAQLIRLVSEKLTLVAVVDILCFNMTPKFFWSVKKGENVVDIKQPNASVLTINERHFSEGTYIVTCHASLGDNAEVNDSDTVSVQYKNSPLVATIVGGSSRAVGIEQSVAVDALSLSYDPDVDRDSDQGLSFSWECGKAANLTSAEQLLVSRELQPCPCVSDQTTGIMRIARNCLDINFWHVFVVSVEKDGRNGTTYTMVNITEEPRPQLKLSCKANCVEKKNPAYSVSMESRCMDCTTKDLRTAKYRWELYERKSINDFWTNVLDLSGMTYTGTNLSSISIAPNKLLPGQWYRLRLTVDIPGKANGFVDELFAMNLPPYGGSCSIHPESGKATRDQFRLLCTSWVDEAFNHVRSSDDTNGGLTYTLLVDDGDDVSPVASSDSVLSAKTNLIVGDPKQDYKLRVIAQVYDSYGGMNETTLFVKVTPPLPSDSGLKNISAVHSLLDTFNSKLENSVVKDDLGELSSFIQSAVSSLSTMYLPSDSGLKNISTVHSLLDTFNSKLENSVVKDDLEEFPSFIESAVSNLSTMELPDGNSKLPADPNSWLGGQPRDVPTGNVSAIPFSELWNDLIMPRDTTLQDTLMAEIDRFIDDLGSTVNSTEKVSLESLFYVSSTFRTAAKQRKLMSIPGMKNAVQSIDRLSGNLSSLVTKHVNGQYFEEVISSVLSSLNKLSNSLSSSPVADTEVSVNTMLERIELEESYLTVDKREEGEMAKEDADLQDDERAFLMSRTVLQQQYEAKQKRQLAKDVTTSVQASTNKVLDAVAELLVSGQTPKNFLNPDLSASVEKLSLERVFGVPIEREGFIFKQERPKTSERKDGENEDVLLKTIVYRKNPFVWDKDSSSSDITSNVVVLDVTNTDLKRNGTEPRENISSDDTKQIVTLPNYKAVVMRTITPEFNPLDHDQMLYHKLELRSTKDSIILYLNSIPYVKYDVYFRSGEFPTSVEYDYKTAIPPTVTTGGNTKLKVMCPGGTLPSSGHVYVGLKPYPLERRRRRRQISEGTVPVNQSSIYTEYEFGLGTVNCKSWDEEKEVWSDEYCSVSEETSENSTVCVCKKDLSKPFTVATSFNVPVNKIDFSTVFLKIDVLNNASVFAVLISVLAVYVLLAVWTRRKDCYDYLKWGVTPLIDNKPSDSYMYIVTVSTGMRLRAGTQSKVGIVISGEDEDSGIRQLNDGIRTEFARQSVMNFLLTVPYSLGDLVYVCVWHDDSGGGNHSSWFLHKIVIEDIQTNRRYTFRCERWLAIDKDDGKIERIVPVSAQDDLVSFGSLFSDNIRTNVTDSHLWLSVIMRPKRSHFTRLQRLSCCLSLLLLTMITSAMFYGAKDNVVRPTLITLGSLRFSLQELYVSFISILIVTPANLLIVLLFKKSKPTSSKTESLLDQKCGFCCKSQTADRKKLEEVMIVQSVHSTTEKMLPHGCMYLAWVVVFLSVVPPAFFLFLYSQQWGQTKSEEWLSSFVLSFFESLVIMDPIKVVVFTVLWSFVFRKADTNDAASVDKDNLDTGNKSNNDMNPTNKDFRRLHSGPLGEDDVRKAQNVRRDESTAFGILKEVTLFIIFLTVVFTIGYSNRDPRSFDVRQNIYNMMVKTHIKGPIGLERVKSKRDFFRWVNETVLPGLFEENHYEGTRKHWRERYYLKDLQNYRVGPPRLRQFRSLPKKSCAIPYFAYMPCQENYNILSEESEDFCVGWKGLPCPERESVEMYTQQAWKFTSSLDIWGLPVWGRYNTYSGGGYISELGVNLQVSTIMLNEKFKYLWLDGQTRAISIEFTIYNPNVNMFCYVTLLVEFPETGGAVKSAAIQPFRAYHHVGALGAYILFNEILFLIYLFGATGKLVFSVRKQGKVFFKSWWNSMDIVCILTCYVSVGMFVSREIMVKETLKKWKENPKEFVNFQHITLWDELLICTIGFICLFCTIRMIKIFGYHKRISSITSVLNRASKDLLYFSIIFFIIFLGFALLGHLLFGRQLTAYSTLLTTSATLIASMIGKTPFVEMRRTEPVLAQIYFALFVFLVVFLLLTMFVAILNESISAVRKEDIADAERFHVFRILLAKFKETLSLFVTKEKTSLEQGYVAPVVGHAKRKLPGNFKVARKRMPMTV